MPSTLSPSSLEPLTQSLARSLLAACRRHPAPTLFHDRLLASLLADDHLKTELFRFVDVFPVLKSPAQIHDHLAQYLTPNSELRTPNSALRTPHFVLAALRAGSLLKPLFARTIASQIHALARTFIAGTTAADALPHLAVQWNRGIAFSLDLLGEACLSHAEAAAYLARYMDLIEKLPALTAPWPFNPTLERDHLSGPAGIIPRVNVSLKISALDGHLSPTDTRGTLERLTASLAPLLQLAAQHRVFLNFDMEHHALHELTLQLFKRCCLQFDFPAGIALQAYLRSADDDARDLLEWSRAECRLITVRLLKGAYWDYEVIHAQLQNWPSPVWSRKSHTDACFERLTEFFLQNSPTDPARGGIKLALATHNVRSVAHAIAALRALGLPQTALEFQFLRGMADDLKSALASGADALVGFPPSTAAAPFPNSQSPFPRFPSIENQKSKIENPPATSPWRVRDYVPLGDLIPGMAYLVRRLLENTSNQGWLHSLHSSSLTDDQLLAPPNIDPNPNPNPNPPHNSSLITHHFVNEPPRNFSLAPIRETFQQALQTARLSPIPSNATATDADQAVAVAQKAFLTWRDVPVDKRAVILRAAADAMHRQRDTLAAEVILEAHKTWSEADSDICEAIDFCRYYAAEAEKLFAPQQLGTFTGEHNLLLHEPRGIAAVIAPWNFPLAIITGMTAAALVTGNAVIVKPAEQTPAIARRLCEFLWQAGAPKDALQFLPGKGEVVGRALVRNPQVAIIAFTGSAAVGQEILRQAYSRPLSSFASTSLPPSSVPTPASPAPPSAPPPDSSTFLPSLSSSPSFSSFPSPSASFSPVASSSSSPSSYPSAPPVLGASSPPSSYPLELPRIVCEMGGKNAIIVDDSADLDEAVLGVRQSAFSYSGQKCSACSRVIVLESIHNSFVNRLLESAKSLVVGDPRDPATDLGPVIDDAAAAKIRTYIEIGKSEATLLYPIGDSEIAPNSFVPHIFTNVLPTHRIAREEIFGPVLSILQARDFAHALELANGVPYKLTGGVYSRTPKHLQQAQREFRVGNLYLNRPITGALVGRQPFGGFGLSGLGTKAGGPAYLLEFTTSRVVTENTLRRGFAPEEPEST